MIQIQKTKEEENSAKFIFDNVESLKINENETKKFFGEKKTVREINLNNKFFGEKKNEEIILNNKLEKNKRTDTNNENKKSNPYNQSEINKEKFIKMLTKDKEKNKKKEKRIKIDIREILKEEEKREKENLSKNRYHSKDLKIMKKYLMKNVDNENIEKLDASKILGSNIYSTEDIKKFKSEKENELNNEIRSLGKKFS